MNRRSSTLVAPILAALIAAAPGHAQQSSPQAPPPDPAAAPAPVRAQNGTSAPRPAQTDVQQDGVTRPLSVVALESRANEPAPIRGAGGGARGGLTAVGDPEPRSFKVHDLITIVVSESSKAKSSANSKTDKKYDLSADLKQFMNLDVGEWANKITLGAADMPQFDVSGKKKFDAKGDVARTDDFTAKVTAEVVEVLPNGTILIEAFKQINMDGETQTMRLSGRCRAEDVDATNSVQSHRLANASIEKTTKGQLRDATDKGIIAKVLDTLFAF
jgi:flagellar L-ring protein precursor FlgH